MKLTRLVATAVLASVFVATHASAELLTNGGFETDTFSGWTLTNTVIGTVVRPTFFFPDTNLTYSPHSGSFFAAMGNDGFDGTVAQSVTDSPGQRLNLTYWLANDGFIPNDFTAEWNGVPLFALANAGAFGYVEHSFNVLATGNDTVTFLERNDIGYLSLDDVSLTPVATAPEPLTLSLFSAGIAGAIAMRRRRKEYKAEVFPR